ncbi:MAG: helix-turn-helix transcriptional regulator [Rhizobiaceae bacterium]|jgi:transcriptional regulator with XRE-family HTH domain
MAREVRAMRKSLKFTQTQLSVIMNVTPQQISKYECGRSRVPLDYFRALQGLLGKLPARGFHEEPVVFGAAATLREECAKLVARMAAIMAATADFDERLRQFSKTI